MVMAADCAWAGRSTPVENKLTLGVGLADPSEATYGAGLACGAASVALFVDGFFFGGFLATDNGLNIIGFPDLGAIEVDAELKLDCDTDTGGSASVSFVPGVLVSACCSAKNRFSSASDSRSKPRSAPVFKLNIFLGCPLADPLVSRV